MSDANRFRFRARCTDGGEWVYGTGLTDFLNVCPTKTGHTWIWSTDYCWIEVDHKTVGQSTGLTDANGTEIFEGYVVTAPNGDVYSYEWNCNGQWMSRSAKTQALHTLNYWETEVIGDIHENPELLDRAE